MKSIGTASEGNLKREKKYGISPVFSFKEETRCYTQVQKHVPG
jgi:hypothetical protein